MQDKSWPGGLPGSQDGLFVALLKVVSTLISEGRMTRAAAVKARLQAETSPPFDEKRLGYTSFREFLKSAESAGVVQLRPAQVGPDLDVLPPSTGSEGTPDGPAPGARIRGDVWNAFSRWDQGFLRLWDTETGRAIRISREARSTEPPEAAALRAAWYSRPGRFVEIDPILPDTVVGWARQWVASLPDDAVRGALENTLGERLPIRSFTELVRRFGLGSSWHETHARCVRGVVENWASDHELVIDLSRSAEPPSVGFPAKTASRSTRGHDEASLRRQVHEMVDEMTVPELLSLSFPLRLTAQS